MALSALVLLGAGCAPQDSQTDAYSTDTPPTEQKQPMEQAPTPAVEGAEVSLADFTEPPTSFPGILTEEERTNSQVILRTSEGDITLAFYGDEAPAAVSNFLILANTGFYDGVRFHRVIENFMIQGGDPQSKDDSLESRWGTGGPGYQFPDELGRGHSEYVPGTLAMANSGSNTNGSQFFIMHGNTPLPNNYTIFGEVVEGQDVVDAIAATETSGSPYDRPVEPITITSAEVVTAN